jgi:hypothetical protein
MISNTSTPISRLLPGARDVLTIAALSPSLFPQIAKTGIEDDAKIFATPLLLKSHKKNIFSTCNFWHSSNATTRL